MLCKSDHNNCSNQAQTAPNVCQFDLSKTLVCILKDSLIKEGGGSELVGLYSHLWK